MKTILTKEAPIPKGHYAQGILAGGFLFISGQLPIDPETGDLVSGGMEEQAVQVLRNLEAVVKAAGGSKEDVVKVTVYIPDIGQWSAVNRIYGEFFGNHKPARSIVPTRELHYGALLEVEAIAWIMPRAQSRKGRDDVGKWSEELPS
ncbi:MAG: Rid family detoxifying hydrolase [Spirochaetes bacterium]|nr:Rid family detoxifying hydrolase [Spirochaetota bacterium]